jgi:hypothetical protein
MPGRGVHLCRKQREMLGRLALFLFLCPAFLSSEDKKKV